MHFRNLDHTNVDEEKTNVENQCCKYCIREYIAEDLVRKLSEILKNTDKHKLGTEILRKTATWKAWKKSINKRNNRNICNTDENLQG